MSAKKTPRGIISDYLDASKTQPVSPHRKQHRAIPRTPESYRGSEDRVLPHNRVANLRKKRRSISSADDEDTPRQLIARYLATADTTAPLVRVGRRTSQSGVSSSQPAMSVSNKRPRHSYQLDDMSIDIQSETPRTLINRYLQNASQTIETPVVLRHQTSQSQSQSSPEADFVQDTYHTPSPFRESSQDSNESRRDPTSARGSRRLNRSATKSNYSLVIPESQGMSSPSTDTLMQRKEYRMPSPFRSSDGEGEGEEEVPLPDISKFHRTHRQGGYNLTVPESMLERHRDQSAHDSRASHKDQMADDDNDDDNDDDDDGAARDQNSMDEAGRDRYRVYDLPMKPVEKSYDDIFAIADSSVGGKDHSRSMTHDHSRSMTHNRSRSMTHNRSRSMTHDHSRSMTHNRSRSMTHNVSSFSPQVTSTQRRRSETMDTEEVMMQSASRHSTHMQDLSYNTGVIDRTTPRGLNQRGVSLSPQRSHETREALNYTDPAHRMSPHRRSPRRSESPYHTDARGMNTLEAREGSGQRALNYTDPAHSMSPPRRSPRRSEPPYNTDSRGMNSSVVAGRAYRRGHHERDHVHSIAEQFSPRISSTQKTFHVEDSCRDTRSVSPDTGRTSPLSTADPSPVVSPARSNSSMSPQSSGRKKRSDGSRHDNSVTPRSRHSLSRLDSRSSKSEQDEPTTISRSARGTPKRSYHDVEEEMSDMNASPVIPNMSASSGRKSLRSQQGTPSRLQASARSLQEFATPTSVRADTGFATPTSARADTGFVTPTSARKILTPRRSAALAPGSGSRMGTPGSEHLTPVHMSQRSPVEAGRTPTHRQSRQGTPVSRSKVRTPGSANQVRGQGSPKSPVVAGRMSRRAQDLVHTLPNISANFSPQVASTQNMATIIRPADDEDPADFDQDVGDPVENEDAADFDEEVGDPVENEDLADFDEEVGDPVENEDLADFDEDVGEHIDDEVDKENDGENRNNNQQEEVEEAGGIEEMEGATVRTTAIPVAEIPQKKAQRAPRKPRQKNPYTIPVTVVKKRFTHYADMRVDKDAMKSVMEISEKYWDNMAADLEAYAKHAGRKRINKADIELLFKRQGHVTDRQSLDSLIEKYLPMEEREKLIPCARAHNKIELNRKYI